MHMLIPAAGRYIRLALGRGRITSDTQRRYVRIMRGILTAMAGKGVAFVVSVASVPLTIGYLGPERYGAWITISAAMTWVSLADFGMSNSLTNSISEAYATDRPDLAQKYVASAFWLLSATGVLAGSIFLGFWHSVAWDRILNVQTSQARLEIAPAIAIAVLIFVLNFPFSLVSKIYGGYQELAVANVWQAFGTALSLVALLLVTHSKGGLVLLVVAVSGSVLTVNIASAIWLFGFSKPWLVPRVKCIEIKAVKKLFGTGGMFFVIQFAGLVLFQTDNIIIAHFMGAQAVTPYSVTWRLFTYTSIFQQLAAPSYWPAYAEAFARGDRHWVRRSFRLNFMMTLGSTILLTVPLVLFGQKIINKWAGSSAVPTMSLLVLMGIWATIFAAMCSQGSLLASSGRLKGQTIYSVAAAGINLVLSITLVRRLGLPGVILGTIAAYLICVLIPQWVEVERAINDPEYAEVEC